MSCVINASTTTGLVESADLSGTLELQSNGTTKLSVLSTGVSGTLIQGTAVASTSGTAIDFTGIPSWAKRITVMFSGVSSNTNAAYMMLQIGAGSIVTTGYLSTLSTIVAASAATTTNTTGFYCSNVQAATDVSNGNLVLTTLGSNSWVISGVLGQSGNARTVIVGGEITLSGTLDRVRITYSNGTDTFDAGSINIQYEG